jgi:hypothetical protein
VRTAQFREVKAAKKDKFAPSQKTLKPCIRCGGRKHPIRLHRAGVVIPGKGLIFNRVAEAGGCLTPIICSGSTKFVRSSFYLGST